VAYWALFEIDSFNEFKDVFEKKKKKKKTHFILKGKLTHSIPPSAAHATGTASVVPPMSDTTREFRVIYGGGIARLVSTSRRVTTKSERASGSQQFYSDPLPRSRNPKPLNLNPKLLNLKP
jgi:hypothetical protein